MIPTLAIVVHTDKQKRNDPGGLDTFRSASSWLDDLRRGWGGQDFESN